MDPIAVDDHISVSYRTLDGNTTIEGRVIKAEAEVSAATAEVTTVCLYINGNMGNMGNTHNDQGVDVADYKIEMNNDDSNTAYRYDRGSYVEIDSGPVEVYRI